MTEQLPVEYQAAQVLADALTLADAVDGSASVAVLDVSANRVRFTIHGVSFHAVVMGD